MTDLEPGPGVDGRSRPGRPAAGGDVRTVPVRSDAAQPSSLGQDVARRMWVVVMAGIPTGVIVAGLGSRLAMLALRLTSPDSVRGLTSDDGFEIGRLTLGGTYNLLMLGAAVGVVGAVAYGAVKPWLVGPGWFRRATVAAASGAVVGSMLVHDDGVDFHVLKPMWLAVALFVALPALFGLAIGLAVDRVAVTGVAAGRRRWGWPLAVVAPFPLVLPVIALAFAVTAVVTSAGGLLRRRFERVGVTGAGITFVVRCAWLTIALLGLVALIGDVQALRS